MSVQIGTPTAPGDPFVPLLPLGPDGVGRSPPRRTHPDAPREHTLPANECQRLHPFFPGSPVPESNDTAMAVSAGGEGGIRTHGALRLTRSPGARVRPDYATSPCKNMGSFVQIRW